MKTHAPIVLAGLLASGFAAAGGLDFNQTDAVQPWHGARREERTLQKGNPAVSLTWGGGRYDRIIKLGTGGSARKCCPKTPHPSRRSTMKKLVLTALSLSVLASAAFADGGDNARAFIERNAVHSQYVQATSAQRQEPASGFKVQAPSPEALSHYADHAIKNNPENDRSK